MWIVTALAALPNRPLATIWSHTACSGNDAMGIRRQLGRLMRRVGDALDPSRSTAVPGVLAKATGLGVADEVSRAHGAVSAEVTQGLAEGALANSGAGVAVAVTGYAGPGGGSEKNPVGTCYIAAAARGKPTLIERHVFPGDRDAVRLAAVGAALELIAKRLG